MVIRSVTPRTPEYRHLVSHREGIGEVVFLVGDPEQVLVRNNDQRVDIAFQVLDAGVGDPHAVRAFKLERLGDNGDRQDAAFFGRLAQ